MKTNIDKPVRYEVWESRCGEFRSQLNTGHSLLANALFMVNWRRKRIRIRTFYDRHLRRRVVQFLVGDGYGVR